MPSIAVEQRDEVHVASTSGRDEGNDWARRLAEMSQHRVQKSVVATSEKGAITRERLNLKAIPRLDINSLARPQVSPDALNQNPSGWRDILFLTERELQTEPILTDRFRCVLNNPKS